MKLGVSTVWGKSRDSVTITTLSSTDGGNNIVSYDIWIRKTCDYIELNVHYCMLFSSRVRVRIRFSVCLVSCYAHVFVLL